MILEGNPSDIIFDYSEGKYKLIEDQSGDLQFEDENGTLWELDTKVQHYLNLIEKHCPCGVDLI